MKSKNFLSPKAVLFARFFYYLLLCYSTCLPCNPRSSLMAFVISSWALWVASSPSTSPVSWSSTQAWRLLFLVEFVSSTLLLFSPDIPARFNCTARAQQGTQTAQKRAGAVARAVKRPESQETGGDDEYGSLNDGPEAVVNEGHFKQGGWSCRHTDVPDGIIQAEEGS